MPSPGKQSIPCFKFCGFNRALLIMAIIEILLNSLLLIMGIMSATVVLLVDRNSWTAGAVDFLPHNTVHLAGLFVSMIMSVGGIVLGVVLIFAAIHDDRKCNIIWCACTEVLLWLGFFTFLSECIIAGFDVNRGIDLCLATWKMIVWTTVFFNIKRLKPKPEPGDLSVAPAPNSETAPINPEGADVNRASPSAHTQNSPA